LEEPFVDLETGQIESVVDNAIPVVVGMVAVVDVVLEVLNNDEREEQKIRRRWMVRRWQMVALLLAPLTDVYPAVEIVDALVEWKRVDEEAVRELDWMFERVMELVKMAESFDVVAF
jgi:hypothetical protein